jgi:xylose isomerase
MNNPDTKAIFATEQTRKKTQNRKLYIIVKNTGFLSGTGLYNWVTRRMSYDKEGLLILRKHLGSLLVLE